MTELATPFGPLTIRYDGRVLEPRQWTELQSRWAAELLVDAPPGTVLELCCGAGQIGLLAAVLSDRPLVAVDLNPAACELTRANADAAGIGDRVEVREGRLDAVLGPDEQFALVVADPPWVRTEQIADFPEDPTLAIDGGADGLNVARMILAVCRGYLPPGGSLLIQLGTADQAEQLCEDARHLGWLGGDRRQGERGVVQQLVAPG